MIFTETAPNFYEMQNKIDQNTAPEDDHFHDNTKVVRKADESMGSSIYSRCTT